MSTLELLKILIPKTTNSNEIMEESGGEETGIIPFQDYANPDFGIADFVDNLDDFMDLNGADDPFMSQIFDDLDHLNDDVELMNLVAGISTTPEVQNDDVREEDEEESSATTSEKKKMKSKRSDRATTLMSERRRRRGMKEKLYALRSLVPNITKVRLSYFIIYVSYI